MRRKIDERQGVGIFNRRPQRSQSILVHFFETFEAFCSKALRIPNPQLHGQGRTSSRRWLPTRKSEEAELFLAVASNQILKE